MKSFLMFVKEHNLLFKGYQKGILETIFEGTFLYDALLSQKLIWRVSRKFPVLFLKNVVFQEFQALFRVLCLSNPEKAF